MKISRIWLRLGLLVLALCAWAVGSACSSSGSGKKTDGAVQDVFVIDYAFGELPPGCPPHVANNVGVGADCTAGGRQCTGNLICTCDTTLGVTPPAGTPCFCSIAVLQPCAMVPAGTCGQNASCCSYMSMASLCVPDACLNSSMCPTF